MQLFFIFLSARAPSKKKILSMQRYSRSNPAYWVTASRNGPRQRKVFYCFFLTYRSIITAFPSLDTSSHTQPGTVLRNGKNILGCGLYRLHCHLSVQLLWFFRVREKKNGWPRAKQRVVSSKTRNLFYNKQAQHATSKRCSGKRI